MIDASLKWTSATEDVACRSCCGLKRTRKFRKPEYKYPSLLEASTPSAKLFGKPSSLLKCLTCPKVVRQKSPRSEFIQRFPVASNERADISTPPIRVSFQ